MTLAWAYEEFPPSGDGNSRGNPQECALLLTAALADLAKQKRHNEITVTTREDYVENTPLRA